MDYPTRYSDAREGGKQARTEIELGFDRRVLRIETSKHRSGGVACEASVMQRTEDGIGLVFAFGLAGDGDFTRVLHTEKPARATATTVLRVHTIGLRSVEALLPEIRAFYKQPATAEA